MDSDAPFHLLDLPELAAYVQRNHQLLRRYFSMGILPEPAHSIYHHASNKTTRRFTRQEADEIKYIFDNAKYGTFAARIKRAEERHIIRV